MRIYEILMLEGIKPIETDFGTNQKLNDKKWLSLDNALRTFFEYNKRIYVVDITSNNVISFATAKLENFDPIDLKNLGYIGKHFTTKEMKLNVNSISIFNRIMYIILKGIEKKQAKVIKFSASPDNEAALSKFYEKLLLNKSFKEELEKIGYEPYGKIHKDYVIRKKE